MTRMTGEAGGGFGLFAGVLACGGPWQTAKPRGRTRGIPLHQPRTRPDSHLAYRPDVDGLRAISILAVVAYHAFPARIPGGFVGVDIFFVISGFLITQIIVKELATGTFSLLAFYQRRVRRIFPALIAVLLVVYAIGWIVLLPADFTALARNIAAGAGFFANLLQIYDANYFAPEAASNPLLHLWSLGIEEQFYIVWPLLLLAVTRWPRGFVTAIAVVATLSMAANLLLLGDHPMAAFYSPISRAWELLAGALLAGRRSHDVARSDRLQNAMAVAGCVLIAVAIMLLNRTTPYPGWAALMPVTGAVLLLAAPRSLPNRFLLAHPVMVFIGLISYPLYLWHWPLLTFLKIVRAGAPTPLEIAAVVALSFALAWLTFRYLERPVRRQAKGALQLSLALAAAGLVALVTIAGAGFVFRFPPDVQQIAAAKIDMASYRCFVETAQYQQPLDPHCIEAGNGPLVLVWGDSTAAALYPGIRAIQQTHPFRLAQFTAAGCLPVIEQCPDFNRQVFALIPRLKPDIVLLKAGWDPQDLPMLGDTIRTLQTLHVPRIMVLGQVRFWPGRGLPQLALNTYRFQRTLLPERIAFWSPQMRAEPQIEAFVKGAGAQYISAFRAFCNDHGCLTRTGPSGADLIAADAHHLTAKGAIFLMHAIAPQFLPN